MNICSSCPMWDSPDLLAMSGMTREAERAVERRAIRRVASVALALSDAGDVMVLQKALRSAGQQLEARAIALFVHHLLETVEAEEKAA